MSKTHQNRNQTESTNPFGTFIECVGAAIVAIAMVPVTIVDAVITSVTS